MLYILDILVCALPHHKLHSSGGAMFRIINDRVSLKIVVALIAVLTAIMTLFTTHLVREREDVLKSELLTKARTMAIVGARTMEQILEDSLHNGIFTSEELFDTDYRLIEKGPLAGSEIPKYHTAYDEYLDLTIQKVQDAVVEEDTMVVFAVLVDRNGYLPTHNTKYSKPLTGNADKDRVGNRTKRLFNDDVGLAAARYDGSDGVKILRQVYQRDTGETMWDVSAPVFVDGRHWGGFRIGFSMKEADQAIADLRNSVVGVMFLLLLTASLTIGFVVSRFMKPLKELTHVAGRVSEGHFEETVRISSTDEIGQLGKAFNKMTQVIVRNLRQEVEKSSHLFESVREAVRQLSSSTADMTAISAQQAAGAAEQAASVQQATTTSEEIAVTSKQVSENALRVENLAERTKSAGSNGTTAANNAMEGMKRLKEQVQTIAEAMVQLGENSQKIGGIVDIIDEISDQTNLLSLNAAIEAAGAGEAGKRFSIVANEVKRLAERTAVSTGQIKSLIEEIQRATNSTIMLTEEGTKGVDSANVLAAKVTEELSNMTQMVDETVMAASEIKLSTQQQTTACEQMAVTILEVRDVADQVANGAQETEHAVNELMSLAESLRHLLEEDLQAKGKVAAIAGAEVMRKILEEAFNSGRFDSDAIFDENYIPIPDTSPQKFHTRYDRYLDETIQDILDGYLQDNHVVFAVLVDRNGYLPTHNSKYSQPLTGDPEKDRMGNRTKRIFNDKVGLAAAKNREEILMQVYQRDTGEKMWDISSPVILNGRHWGAFRIGFSMD